MSLETVTNPTEVRNMFVEMAGELEASWFELLKCAFVVLIHKCCVLRLWMLFPICSGISWLLHIPEWHRTPVQESRLPWERTAPHQNRPFANSSLQKMRTLLARDGLVFRTRDGRAIQATF